MDFDILSDADADKITPQTETMDRMMIWFISFLNMIDVDSSRKKELLVSLDAPALIRDIVRKWSIQAQLL
jgi:hypothetical protein